eukprot:scaffold248671_cov17-Tisochrysis_lutea.AAC.1
MQPCIDSASQNRFPTLFSALAFLPACTCMYLSKAQAAAYLETHFKRQCKAGYGRMHGKVKWRAIQGRGLQGRKPSVKALDCWAL